MHITVSRPISLTARDACPSYDSGAIFNEFNLKAEENGSLRIALHIYKDIWSFSTSLVMYGGQNRKIEALIQSLRGTGSKSAFQNTLTEVLPAKAVDNRMGAFSAWQRVFNALSFQIQAHNGSC